MISGTPEVVEAAADEYDRAAEQFEDVRVALVHHAQQICSNWFGLASQAALDHLLRRAARCKVGTEVCRDSARALRDFAAQLRIGKRAFADAQQARNDAQAEHDAVTGQGPAAKAARQDARQRIAAANAEMNRAEQRVDSAGDAAATRIDRLTAELPDMIPPDATGTGQPTTRSGSGPPSNPIEMLTETLWPPTVNPSFDEYLDYPGGQDSALLGKAAMAFLRGEDGELSFSDVGHLALDKLGFIPGFGIPIDLINAAWYEAEGKHVAAGTSALGAVPIVGWLATGGKWAARAGRSYDEVLQAIRGAPGVTAQRSKEIAEAAREKGVRIFNEKYAGGRHRETGVPFKESGFPDFSEYAEQAAKKFDKPTTVQVEGINGVQRHDARLANNAAGFDETPKGYTWHHFEDCKTMQLVPTGVHNETGHTGCRALLRAGVDPRG